MADKRLPATKPTAAVALRVAGASYAQIADTLDYESPGRAQTAVEQALAATVTTEDLMTQRALEQARMDRMLQAYWPSVMDSKSTRQFEAGRMVLSISDRRSKLLGLDAPTKHEVYTPTAQEIHEVVSKIRGELDGPVEAEIIEATVIDDIDPDTAGDVGQADAGA